MRASTFLSLVALLGVAGAANETAALATPLASGTALPRPDEPQPSQPQPGQPQPGQPQPSQPQPSQPQPSQPQPSQPQPTPPPPADTKVEAKAELIVLAASNDGSGIDAKIPNQDQLKKPPFSAYNSYRLVEQANLALPKGKAVERTLPDKGKLSLTLEDVLPKTAKEDARYVVAASILKADGEKFLPRVQLNSKKGEWFFVAGQKFKDGILVLGFRVVQ